MVFYTKKNSIGETECVNIIWFKVIFSFKVKDSSIL